LSALKDINWNRLSITIPGSWEAIVKNPRHLIFEHDLSPCLEIRWQQSAKHPSRRHTESIVKQLGHRVVPADAPPSHSLELPDDLTRRFETTVLDGGTDGIPSLLLICRKCSTTILAGLHQTPLRWSGEHGSALASLRCHGDEETAGNWRIHDFFFSVPDGFELDSCVFQFGASNLLFKSRKADLRIIRMAPASYHLKRNGFKTLFASFCAAPSETIQLVDPTTLRYHSSPALTKRLWQRLRRQYPFARASFTHFTDTDRIMGWLLSTGRRPPSELVTELENGYGIIQEEAYTTNADT